MNSDRDVECDNEDKQVNKKAKGKITAKKNNRETRTEEVSTQTKSKASTRNPRLSVRNEEEELQIVYDSNIH